VAVYFNGTPGLEQRAQKNAGAGQDIPILFGVGVHRRIGARSRERSSEALLRGKRKTWQSRSARETRSLQAPVKLARVAASIFTMSVC